jgi:hypothetical protein
MRHPLHRYTQACLLLICILLLAPSAEAITQNNACLLPSLGEYRDIVVDVSGLPDEDTIVVGDFVMLSTTVLEVDMDAALILELYAANLLSPGVNAIPSVFDLDLDATLSLPGSQMASGAGTAFTTISDPDGTPNTGDETATPAVVTVFLSDTVWQGTTGGSMDFTQGTLSGSFSLLGGLVTLGATCEPGFADVPPTTFTSVPAAVFASVAVVAPPTAVPALSARGLAALGIALLAAGVGGATFPARQRSAARRSRS